MYLLLSPFTQYILLFHSKIKLELKYIWFSFLKKSSFSVAHRKKKLEITILYHLSYKESCSEFLNSKHLFLQIIISLEYLMDIRYMFFQ